MKSIDIESRSDHSSITKILDLTDIFVKLSKETGGEATIINTKINSAKSKDERKMLSGWCDSTLDWGLRRNLWAYQIVSHCNLQIALELMLKALLYQDAMNSKETKQEEKTYSPPKIHYLCELYAKLNQSIQQQLSKIYIKYNKRYPCLLEESLLPVDPKKEMHSSNTNPLKKCVKKKLNLKTLDEAFKYFDDEQIYFIKYGFFEKFNQTIPVIEDLTAFYKFLECVKKCYFHNF